MSKVRDKNAETHSQRKQNVLILQDNASQQSLVKVNRYLLYMVMSLMTVVFLLSFLLWPAQDPLDSIKVSAQHLQQVNPAISAEINTLKGQVVGLVGGSIESKLRILEESLKAGSVNNAMGAIQDLKRDVKMLQAYSEPVASKEPVALANEILLEELTHLKNLLYLTLASASLMFAAVAGVWVRKQYLLAHEKKAFLSQNQE